MVYVEARGGQARAGDHIELCLLWLCLHLVPQSGARVRFLLGSNVNTTFFSSIHTRIRRSARVRVQGLSGT